MMFRSKFRWRCLSLLILVPISLYFIVMDFCDTKISDLSTRWTLNLSQNRTFSDQIPSIINISDNTFHQKPRQVTLEKYGNFRDLDSYQKVPWDYDKRFKNPCWYEEDELKCLPYFFIAGIKKCGTTTLFSRLKHHPELVHKRLPGEVHFFDYKATRNDSGTRDIYYYIDIFTNNSKEIERLSTASTSEDNPNKHIFCDATPDTAPVNFNWWKMPSNEGLEEPRYVSFDYIHRLIPTAKIIMMFRDPVERYYSDYMQHMKSLSKSERSEELTQLAGPEHFDAIARKAVSDYNVCLQQSPLRRCVYNKTLYWENTVSLSAGIYHVFWQELMRLFPREQIHVILTKDLDSIETIQRMFAFLEMSPLSDETLSRMSLKRSNVRPDDFASRGSMLNSTHKLLYDFYKSHNVQMADLMEEDEFLFLN